MATWLSSNLDQYGSGSIRSKIVEVGKQEVMSMPYDATTDDQALNGDGLDVDVSIMLALIEDVQLHAGEG